MSDKIIPAGTANSESKALVELHVVAMYERLRKYTSVLAASLPRNEWHENMSVGPCGMFGDAYLAEEAAFKRGENDGVVSPGFCYSKDSIQDMMEAGFNTDPSAAIVFRYYNPGIESDSTDIAKSPLATLKARFESLGIKCFIATGGSFFDHMDDTAVVLDANDPEFFAKIKSLFLQNFPQKTFSNIRGRMDGNRWLPTESDRRHYLTELLVQLRSVFLDMGVDLKDTDSLAMPDSGISEDIKGCVNYEINFIRPPLLAMKDALSLDEKMQLMGELLHGIAPSFSGQYRPQSKTGRGEITR